ncbi:deoxyribodipyrimidine photo-lyase [Thalassotalea sp. Y01]|uniref:deoxyribodipyrimidine photo-lyase n=1 Tax=Thalassotalea sp. Y01 TaxID=2729613 RepID=UPI00145D2D6B|nr:deoxyribodipyrimidine photo-lyase [Thalassotalea sp. Y01]NMP15087.1 deoxyribodipyrimidine photo-lyase [Thalassotalea sp. Y01]
MATDILLWFRNDLRLQDNPAVKYALDNGLSKAIYFTTPGQWQAHNLSAIKVDFMLRHVALLQQQLKAFGVSLQVVEVEDFAEQELFLRDYCLRHDISQVVANAELEINERRRDQQLKQSGMALTLFEADVIVNKGAIRNKQGEMYKVYTPFRRAWLAHLLNQGFNYQPQTLQLAAITEQQLLPIDTAFKRQCSLKWPLATDMVQHILPSFLQEKVSDYEQHRDIPSVKGTSGLSAYLAIGAISPRYVLALLLSRDPDLLSRQSGGTFTFLNELVWREFYRHLLHHFPKLAMGENFNGKYDSLAWHFDEQKLRAWQQGKTGYPIVDAAMRQLLQTGWMHNRLRMIVASFLTKHLLLDWRLGERFFSQQLIDADLAANNGGWQWASGTGCDAQPYFRIFNPISQSKKFDPDGNFIRRYLPELAHVPDKYIHFPHDYIKEQGLTCYWPAIVEHKQARLSALQFYKQAV